MVIASTKCIFIPVVELVLAFKSIHVPLTELFLIVLIISAVIYSFIEDKVSTKDTNPTVTTTTPEVSK